LSTTETQVIVLPEGSDDTVIVFVEVLTVPPTTDTPPLDV
jgi:hypothetical protein